MSRYRLALPTMALLAAAACGSPGPSDSTSVRTPSFDLIADPGGPAGAEQIVVCKQGGSGTFDFTYSGAYSGGTSAGGFSLQPGECWRVGFFGGAGTSMTITETAKTGFEVVSISVDQRNGADQFVTGTNSVSGVLASGTPTQAAYVVFTNRAIEIPPPPPPPGGDGCTPGYWKNHTRSWQGYTTGQTAGSVFTIPGSLSSLGSKTLLATLDGGGGSGDAGAAKILLRAATAALLNAAHSGVNYTQTQAAIISAVNTALASGRNAMIALAASIDNDNNLGCPLN